jgi:predicted aminopeptidase
VLVLLVAAFVSLPIGRYLIRGAIAEAAILARRRPIPLIVSDTTVPAATRVKLRLVLDARDFAVRALGLEARESFTTFTQLERDTLVLVVSAARRDTLAPYTWWFPIVGRVPYKGFFDFAEARRERETLQARGFDTYMRPASAFSTLGWFNDPLLSTTLRDDTLGLANTVLHELTHNTLFVPSKVTFNESLANFVGARGAAAFFRARGQPAAAREVERQWEDEKQLSSFWLTAARAVDSAFAAHPADSATRVAAGDTVYMRLRRLLVEELAPYMPTYSKEGLRRMQLDNASLLAHRVYAADLWLFDEVWRRTGGDVRRAVFQISRLVRGAEDPFDAVRAWVVETPVPRPEPAPPVPAPLAPPDTVPPPT